MAMSGRPKTRRRGAELERALHAAALAELAELGYRGMTMDGVAARSGTGKAAVYRRWPNKHELVLAALRDAIPPAPTPDPELGLRDNLGTMLRTLCDVLAGRTPLPAIGVMVDLLREPELRSSFDDEIVRPRLEAIDALLADAQRSGEIAPGALGPLATLTGPALIVHWLVVTGETPSSSDIDDVVDTVLAGATPAPRGPAGTPHRTAARHGDGAGV